jgi:hypothetical protein
MRGLTFGLAFPVLTACLGGMDGTTSPWPAPGTYRGDHGPMTDTHGLESELVLGEDGSFRYFFIYRNTAFQTSKGEWSADADRMIWRGMIRANLYHGGFRQWDTAATPDTSILRKMDAFGFERLELSYDSLFGSVIRWVGYRLVTPEAKLPEGAFEYSETYPDPVDTTLTIQGLTRLEFIRDGLYNQKIFQNDYLIMEDVDSSWTQSGTHLITTRNRHCAYEPGYASCGAGPPGYEYIARLSDVGYASFRLWVADDFSFQPGPHWAEFRKTP